ncbi:MAG: MOSC domain-containing protein [Candidatus Poribacteria bacterium]|nr:MOSC domain-containing protein [Candidatus Poribacteria bacterium]
MSTATMEIAHLTTEQIEAKLDWIQSAPTDNGTLEGICIRPASNERVELERCRLSPKLGVEGDSWARKCWKTLADGSPDPDVQVTIMNARAIEVMAGSRDRWKWAGDQLFADFNVGVDNLQPGDRVRIGDALLEITAEPHNGCDKFKDRFGLDALKYVNSPDGKSLRLRGIYARIVEEGVINVGDTIRKVNPR